MPTDAPPVRPGRKRSDDSRRAILDAAWDLAAEGGYAKLTVEAIAARAGAGKTTIRRWWPSKADVLAEAIAERAAETIAIPDEGSYRADLREFLLRSFASGDAAPEQSNSLRALMAHAQIDSAFLERFRAGFIARRREALSAIVERARARGDLPLGLRPDTAADIVFGVIWYRMLLPREPLGQNGARVLADELANTLAGM